MKYNLKKIIIGFLTLLIMIELYILFQPIHCSDVSCFEKNMISCKKANFINDQQEAVWNYDIKGVSGEECEIEVTLEHIRSGKINSEKLQGKSMDCFYPPNVFEYPEKNLDLCHGRLKEDMQELILINLHEYVLDNLDVIGRGVSEL